MAIKWLEPLEGRPDVEFEGAVLNGHVFHNTCFNGDYETVYASVWDAAQACVRDIAVGTVSYGSSWYQAHAGTDATDEIKALAEAYLTEQKRKQYAHAQVIQDWKRTTGIIRGNRVVVRYGRKIPKGTIAIIERVATQYGLAVLLNGIWTDAKNVHVLVNCVPTELNVVHPAQTSPITDAKIYASHPFEVSTETL